MMHGKGNLNILDLQNVENQFGKAEKRPFKGAMGEAEPLVKRIALTDVLNSLTLKNGTPVAVDPCPGYDYDKECGRDALHVAEYAAEIFKYYKYRQGQFTVSDYLRRQEQIDEQKRATLVNWLVGVQEQFEFNHETLYLAVKIADLYMDRTQRVISKRDVQLVGGAAVFLAAKFDERIAPLIDDILYMADDSYRSNELIDMEREMFKTVGFDLGIPLSYRFLRRYARTIKADMTTLTLARFVLETSLLFYQFVNIPDDYLAAGALLLALRMRGHDWDSRLVKYTGYVAEQVEPLMWTLNHMLIIRPDVYPNLGTVHLKYSHEIFFQVALNEPLPDMYKEGDRAYSVPLYGYL